MKTLFNDTIENLIELIKSKPVNSRLLSGVDEKNFDNMIEKMNNGCSKLTAAYQSIPCPMISIASPTYQLENEGLFFDVATFLNGTPECWLNESFNKRY